MGRSLFAVILLFIICHTLNGQDKYFIAFTDKNGTPYTTDNPLEFLSSKSVARRAKQNISIENRDLPVSPSYIQQVVNQEVKLLYPLKWLNGIVVIVNDNNELERISKYPFVNDVKHVFEANFKGEGTPDDDILPVFSGSKDTNDYYDYGSSSNQIKMLNGHLLHNRGYRGNGVTVAVLDAGFYRADQLPAFDSLFKEDRIVFVRDFVNPKSNLFAEHSHGMLVLSVLAGNIPGSLIGTAPQSNYVLIRTEDANSEQLIEEYNWVAGAELADSIGADIVSSSLGYNIFDASEQNHLYTHLDGETTVTAFAANVAAASGMVVVVSAGNEADNSWKYIVTPADAPGSLAVGAVNEAGKYASFSSVGPSADGRIKPDVVAMGVRTVIQAPNGQIGTADGTSLAAPVIAGLTACLWQALPMLSASQLVDRIKGCSSQSAAPTNTMGFGMPNYLRALENIIVENSENKLIVYPNPTDKTIKFILPNPVPSSYTVVISNSLGTELVRENVTTPSVVHSTSIPEEFPAGVYIISMNSELGRISGKVIKW